MNYLITYYRTRKISFYSYLGIVAAVCCSKVVIILSDISHPLANSSTLNWDHLLLVLLIGFILLVFAPLGNIENFNESNKNIKNYLYLPIFIGILFGIYEIIKSLILGYPNFHVKFPYSIPVYISGGTLYEIKYHLIPIIFGSIILLKVFKKRYSNLIFWILAFTLSIYEPYKQIRSMVDWKIISGSFWIIESAIGIFVANIIPFYFLKKHGFVSMLTMRLTTYFMWHIIWPPIYFN
jgi:hypothetical protein